MRLDLFGKPVKKTPYNKGDAYEAHIVDLMENKNLLPPNFARAGAGGGSDAIFLHHGKPFKLEIKNSLGADYGQRMMKWSKEAGWHWCKNDKLSKLYNSYGMIELANSKNFNPHLYTMEKENITPADKKEDMHAFEDRTTEVNSKAFYYFYELKDVYYLQVGNGYGFYRLKKDPAGLGVPKYKGKFILRLRCKPLTTLPTHNYRFYTVLITSGKPKKSEFNLEPDYGQLFPPIEP